MDDDYMVVSTMVELNGNLYVVSSQINFDLSSK